MSTSPSPPTLSVLSSLHLTAVRSKRLLLVLGVPQDGGELHPWRGRGQASCARRERCQLQRSRTAAVRSARFGKIVAINRFWSSFSYETLLHSVEFGIQAMFVSMVVQLGCRTPHSVGVIDANGPGKHRPPAEIRKAPDPRPERTSACPVPSTVGYSR